MLGCPAWKVLVIGAIVFNGFVQANPLQTVLKASNALGLSHGDEDWNFGEKPHINSTHNFVFDTVASLMQHWSNTRYRNGHNIVPVTLPVGTLLYHGTGKNKIPETPEWTATDPEHSYLFCRTLKKGSGCWHLTLVATRPLKLLYFDGSSAAKMQGGPMDSQDIVLWGQVMPEKTGREMERIESLCRFGKQYQMDGFVRMEMNFEVMLCDFAKGVQVVSFLNLADPSKSDLPGPPPLPPHNGTVAGVDGPVVDGDGYRVIESGSWHNHFPGDTRIKIDYSKLISFYDTSLFPSLQEARRNQTRLKHRLSTLSTADVQAFEARLAEVLQQDSTRHLAHEVDWQSLFKVIQNRYAERLELLHYILNSTTPSDDHSSVLKRAQGHVRGMLLPYILQSAVPVEMVSSSSQFSNHSWAAPVFELCATTHIKHLQIDPDISNALTHSERLLLASVKGVSKEICRVLVGIWAEGKENDLDTSKDLLWQWKARIESLMAWLDWTLWVRCRLACSYEEFCYLPTWPFFRPPGGHRRGPNRKPIHPNDRLAKDWPSEDEELEEEWIDPQPKCIKRV